MSDLSDLYTALDNAATTMTFSSQDWSQSPDFAWLYGILVGWDQDPTGGDVDQAGGAIAELAANFGWDDEKVALLRRLRAAVEAFDINKVAALSPAAIDSSNALMPVFAIKGKDKLAPDAIAAYAQLCLEAGLTEQWAEVEAAHSEVVVWQDRHPDLVKTPDHKHVPATQS